MNKTLKLFVSVIGVIASISLIIASTGLQAPGRMMMSSDVHRYVGGDAYNFIMESNLRAADIIVAELVSAIYLIGGLIMLLISLLGVAGSIQNKKSPVKPRESEAAL